MPGMTARVLTKIEDGVATVTLNRADKRNGLDLAMFDAVVEAGEALIDDKHVRAVVLHGDGQAFCAGLDFKWFLSNPSEGQRLLARTDASIANLAQRIAWIWQEVPVPVIAAVHGVAFGGGLQLALAADIRYVAADAQLSVMEIKYGLIPDMSITQTLLELVPADRAKELVFTGRIFSGTEAVALGVATEISEDPFAAAMATAKVIASKSPHAIRANKALLNQAPKLTAAQALALETELQLGLLGSANQLEAVQASMMKREPKFSDPE
jgi:enoyl-CoA hydratase/carnithine racemase